MFGAGEWRNKIKTFFFFSHFVVSAVAEIVNLLSWQIDIEWEKFWDEWERKSGRLGPAGAVELFLGLVRCCKCTYILCHRSFQSDCYHLNEHKLTGGHLTWSDWIAFFPSHLYLCVSMVCQCATVLCALWNIFANVSLYFLCVSVCANCRLW